MAKRNEESESLKQALNYDWPEIQKHLIAEGGGGVSLDSWWLDNFDRKDVIMQLPGVVIMNTKPWHTEDVVRTFHEAYGIRQSEECEDCFAADDIQEHIDRFPEGQFMAMRISGPGAGHAIAMAVTMRTSRPPTAPILPWREAIGELQLSAHESDGEWLYGVENGGLSDVSGAWNRYRSVQGALSVGEATEPAWLVRCWDVDGIQEARRGDERD